MVRRGTGLLALVVAASASFVATRLVLRSWGPTASHVTGRSDSSVASTEEPQEERPFVAPGSVPVSSAATRPETESPPRGDPPPSELRPFLFAGWKGTRADVSTCFAEGLRRPLKFRIRVALLAAEGRLRQRGALRLADVQVGGDPAPADVQACMTAALQNVFDAEIDDDAFHFDGEIDEDVSIGTRGSLRVRWTDCALVGATKLRVVLRDPISTEPHDVRDVPCTDGAVTWSELDAGYWMVTLLTDAPPEYGAFVEAEVVAEETVSPVGSLELIAPASVQWSTAIAGCADATVRLAFVDPTQRDARFENACATGSAAFPFPDLGPWEVTARVESAAGALGIPARRRFLRTPAGGVLQIQPQP